MARALRIQYPNAYYHVTCRGNERKAIFRNDKDREMFLDLLSRSLDIFNVHLLAYACMPNHFHLLVTTPESNLSQFMRHFNISYTGAFNRKYRRSGHLYQGRYKSLLIDADNYLLEVSRYIHLNPLRVKSIESVQKRWNTLLGSDETSLPGYVSERKKKGFIHYETVLNQMAGPDEDGRKRYRDFVKKGTGKDIESPLKSPEVPGIVGGKDFLFTVRLEIDLHAEYHREKPAVRHLRKPFSPDELIEAYAKIIGVERKDLCSRGRQSIERSILMELLYRWCRITQPEIGALTGGIDYSAVSQSRKRLRIRLDQDTALQSRFEAILRELTEKSRVKI